MTGCELKKCTSFLGGVCAYSGKVCKYNEIEGESIESVITEIANELCDRAGQDQYYHDNLNRSETEIYLKEKLIGDK
jgi:hypothetical protein